MAAIAKSFRFGTTQACTHQPAIATEQLTHKMGGESFTPRNVFPAQDVGLAWRGSKKRAHFWPDF
jgi:hypothetical protein